MWHVTSGQTAGLGSSGKWAWPPGHSFQCPEGKCLLRLSGQGRAWLRLQSVLSPSAPQPRRWTVYLSPPSTFALLATGPPAHPRSRNHFHLRLSGLSWPSQSEPMKHKAPETPPHSTDFPKCPELSCFSPGLPILLVPDSIVSCLETITDFWFPWSVAALQSVLHRATRGIPFKLHTLCSNPPVAFFPLRVLTGGL